MTSYTYPPIMPAQLVIEFKTNNYPWENQYTLKDASGTVIRSRDGAFLSAGTIYRDTVSLTDGCYEFELTDSGEDGLSWWANTAQGTGFVRFKKVTPVVVLKSFNSDFGGQVYQQFTVNTSTGIDDFIMSKFNSLDVYPNPGNGYVYINLNLNSFQSGKVEIRDLLGKKVYEYEFKNKSADAIEADLSGLQKGVYFVNLQTDTEHLSKKLIIQ
jgi:hypothetical protein